MYHTSVTRTTNIINYSTHQQTLATSCYSNNITTNIITMHHVTTHLKGGRAQPNNNNSSPMDPARAIPIILHSRHIVTIITWEHTVRTN